MHSAQADVKIKLNDTGYITAGALTLEVRVCLSVLRFNFLDQY